MAESIPHSEYERKVLGWAKEALEESEAFLKSQRGYNRIADSIDAIMGDRNDIRSSSLSSTTANDFGKIEEELAADLTDIKPFWVYNTNNKKWQQHADNFGKCSLHWWLVGGAARAGGAQRFTDVLHYALAGATGWAHLTYSDKWKDITLEAEDPRDVLPIRPSSYDTIQDALGVIVRRERTVNYVRAMKIAEGKEERIQATRDGSVQASLSNTRAGKIMDWLGSPFRNRLFNNQPARDIPRIPTLDLYTMYLDDQTRHESVRTRYMGPWIDDRGTPKEGSNYSYKVEKGELLYPNKRLVVFTDSVVLYDGPSPFWHGMFPLVKLTPIPKPWTWLGKGAMWDCLPLQRSLDKLLRVVDDHMEKVARPDVKADKNSMSKAALERIDTRKAGLKYMTNPMAGKGFEIQTVQPLPSEVMNFIQYYSQKMRELSGVQDVSQLMQLKQLPSNDTVEDIMGKMSGAVRLRSRVIEGFMREFAQQMAFNVSQWYTLPMRLAILGEKGMTFEDFDTDPKSFIPDYVHEDDVDELTGLPKREAMLRGPRPRYSRAKAFLQQFTYNIAPSSLLASSEIQQKMMYVMLGRAGLIDPITLLEKVDIPNIGANDAPTDIIGRQQWLQERGLLEMTVSPQGRKATGQTAPRAVLKES